MTTKDNTKEINFEEKIEWYLTSFGGYTKGTEEGYDPKKWYKPSTLIEFVKKTQPLQWKRFAEHHESNAERYFIDMVEKRIRDNGLLQMLREWIKLDWQTFKLIFFKPETWLNEEIIENYNNNILECVRQLHYSEHNENSVDVALFFNWFPLILLELKNQYTNQNIKNAIRQWREDRDPNEPIFRFNERCLVFFAVDLFECWLTTKLAGIHTHFIPFNQWSNWAGNIWGKWNPNNTQWFWTAYLWEKVLTKEVIMDIIWRYIHLEKKKDKKNKKYLPRNMGKIIFPRYHQLDVVTKIIEDVRKNGAWKSYLIQHSAGSWKSNSIAWLSYRLANLHNKKDEKIFNSVIVITDRKVLDAQLQETIFQFDHVVWTVEKIDDKKHSWDLKEAINNWKKIIITTLQKFPYIYREIQSTGKKFAVIIDEAHSSQSWKAASKLKAWLWDIEQVLAEYAEEERREEEKQKDYEDEIIQELASHGNQDNISFFAFTATPKNKTLQRFWVLKEDWKYRPFHIYSMQQAIEEGFILDVLQNYMTYKVFYKIVQTSVENPTMKVSEWMKLIARYASLHPHNIKQKTEIILQHFLNTTQYKINGNAKAMVVTSSRLHAVRYIKAFREYIKEHWLNGIDVLVAFSWEVNDWWVSYTEPEMNVDYKGDWSNIKEKQLPERFEEDYNILIVADKYQTGFDQPLLHTMYVDKPLSWVKAVQTLSRLNRVCPGKVDTFVLDFVNKAEDIQASFQPYYQGTISEGFDTNNIYDILGRVQAYQLYDNWDVEWFAEVYNSGADDMEKLGGYLIPAKSKYNELEEEDQNQFKRNLQAFIRCYDFVTQVTRIMDVDLYKQATFCKYLNKILPKKRGKLVYDIDDKIELEFYKQEKGSLSKIPLVEEIGELKPATWNIWSWWEWEEAPLSEIVNKINEKYKTNFTNMDKVMEQITKDFLDDEKMVKFAQNKKNSPEDFRKVYNKEFPEKTINRFQQNNEMFNKLMEEPGYMEDFMKDMFEYIYKKLKEKWSENK